MKWTFVLAMAIALAGFASASQAATPGLDQSGKPDLKSAGPIAFGPDGVLFVADPAGAAVFAIEVPKAKPVEGKAGEFKVAGVDAKVASLLGTTAGDILINDLAVQPGSSVAYLSVSRGKGPAGTPALVTVDSQGAVALVGLDKVNYAKVALSNAPEADAKDKRGNSLRNESITDLAYIDGRVLVAGLSNEEFASKLRAFRFPFGKEEDDTSIEIYHGAHGAFETRAPVRTFVPLIVAGEPQILAAYTCTPLVRFPLSDLKPGAKVRGTTIAELGNRNRPLDIVSYEKDGKTYLLIANSARGVMKVTTETIADQKGITEKVADKAGLAYETLEALKGVEHLDKLSPTQALLLVRTGDAVGLESIQLP